MSALLPGPAAARWEREPGRSAFMASWPGRIERVDDAAEIMDP